MQNGNFQSSYVSLDKFVEVRHFQDLPPEVHEGDIITLGELGQVCHLFAWGMLTSSIAR
jgi:hypothetical protein